MIKMWLEAFARISGVKLTNNWCVLTILSLLLSNTGNDSALPPLSEKYGCLNTLSFKTASSEYS